MKAASVTTILGLILISGALLAATATPDGGSEDPAQAAFDRLDRDRDNRISREEAEVNAGLATQFTKFDRDSDGTLDWREFLRHEEPEEFGS